MKIFVGNRRRDMRKILEIPLDKSERMVYNICVRGYSLMVKLQLPKLAMRVRFPLLAPKQKGAEWGVYHKAGKRIIYIGDAFFAFQPTVEKSRLCSYCQKKIAVI